MKTKKIPNNKNDGYSIIEYYGNILANSCNRSKAQFLHQEAAKYAYDFYFVLKIIYNVD